MKSFFELSCCFLYFAVLISNIAASHPSQSPSEDAYARADINQSSDPIFTKNVFVLRGKTIELFPIGDDALIPNAAWHKNSLLLDQTKRRTDGEGREFAVIEHADFGDNGVYTYEATEGKSNETYAIKLKVLSAPFFASQHSQPRNVDTVENKTVEIKCEISGVPKPEVQWMRNGEEVIGERYEITSDGSLRIRDVVISDTGRYTCRATNEYGEVDASARLAVKMCTKIIEYPMDNEMLAGDTATFRCKAQTDPTLPLRVSWLRNNQSIDVFAEPRTIQHADNSLMIVKANNLDSSTYTCVANTDLDEVRAQATLVVHGEPNPPIILRVTCGPNEAHIFWVPANDSWWPIRHYSVQCNTSFTPDTWVIVTRRVPVTFYQTYAVKLSAWANYTFRVIAWNEHGPSEPSTHSSVCTTLSDVPYKNPENVTGKGDDSTNLVIRWNIMPQIEHNAPNFLYRIYYKRDLPGEKWIQEDIHDWRTNEINIDSNQTSYQEYKIKVVAVNERGESRETPKEVVGFSGEDVPLQAPGNVTFVKMAFDRFSLSWNKVTDESVRGELQNYKISFWNVRSKHTSVIATTKPSKTQVSVYLHSKGIHHATIRACNRRFEGPPSEKVIVEVEK